MATIPQAAADHYRTIQGLQLVAVKAGRRTWRRLRNAPDLTSAWQTQVEQLHPVVENAQYRAALAGALYSAATLAQQGEYVAPEVFVNPTAIAGYAADGRDLDGLLYSPVTTVKSTIAGGSDLATALAVGLRSLEQMLATVVSDAGRQAAGADIAARPGVGYVRMLNPPSCPRCMILAGRFYRWNSGFDRHPRCDCVHVAARTTSRQAARDEGLLDDPYDAFRRLTPAEQDRLFGRANAQAIRDGADISQVVNARRGMTPNGNFTVEGTTRRGNASTLLRPGQRRMTPELIYQQARNREEALDLLRQHGYLLPQGQVPTGALRGQREGFGALGRGGTRRAASDAVTQARIAGQRDPNNRYTMTADERRIFDARTRYEIARAGYDPFVPGTFGQTPSPDNRHMWDAALAAGRRASPEVLARTETEYRTWLAEAERRSRTIQ